MPLRQGIHQYKRTKNTPVFSQAENVQRGILKCCLRQSDVPNGSDPGTNQMDFSERYICFESLGEKTRAEISEATIIQLQFLKATFHWLRQCPGQHETSKTVGITLFEAAGPSMQSPWLIGVRASVGVRDGVMKCK